MCIRHTPARCCAQTRAQTGADLGHPRAHVGNDARDGLEPLAQKHAEAFTFAAARGDHVGKCHFEQIQRRLAQAFLIDLLA